MTGRRIQCGFGCDAIVVVYLIQVITSLQRAIDCTHKEAVDFATSVDREVSDVNYINCAFLFNCL